MPKIEWVAPVVNWFATDLNAGNCQIFPGVEFKDDNAITSPDLWQVSHFSRSNAHLITQKNESPIYRIFPS